MSAGTDVDAVVAGHLCLDIIPEILAGPGGLAALLTPGKLSVVGPALISTGGAVSNTGLALSRLGIPTSLMGKIGADLFGQAVGDVVAAYGPELSDDMIVDPAVSTSYTVVINLPGVDRILLNCPGANDSFTADDVCYATVAQARLFHFGYPPLMRLMYEDGGRELAELFRRVKATGCTTSLDMSLPDPASAAGRADWPAILQATLPAVDIFAPSVEEILYMLRRETYDQVQAAGAIPKGRAVTVTPAVLDDLTGQLLAWGAKIVLIKLGEQGVYLRTAGRDRLATVGRGQPSDRDAWAGRELWAPCFQVSVVGTTGAGDATIAGFLSAFLRDLAPEDALTAAVAVGACNVEAADALSGLRTWDETWARIAAGWQRHILQPNASGQDIPAGSWRFDAQHALWVGPKDAVWP